MTRRYLSATGTFSHESVVVSFAGAACANRPRAVLLLARGEHLAPVEFLSDLPDLRGRILVHVPDLEKRAGLDRGHGPIEVDDLGRRGGRGLHLVADVQQRLDVGRLPGELARLLDANVPLQTVEADLIIYFD